LPPTHPRIIYAAGNSQGDTGEEGYLPLGVFTVRFGSVFIKKSNQTEIFFFKKKTETEPKPVQTDRFRFGSVF
jgi:hypothetical protein